MKFRQFRGIIEFLFITLLVLFIMNCAPENAFAHTPGDFPEASAGQSHEIEYNRSPSSSPDDAYREFERDGRLYLTLNDCLRIALRNNHDIRLTREVLVQADATITQVRSAMLPALSAEATFTRMDEELSFSVSALSMTFMDRDLYTAGIVVRQPIFMGGRLNAARKASQYSRDAQSEANRSVEDEIIFQVTRVYMTAQLAEAFQKVAVEAVNLLEAHEHDVSALVNKGVIPEIDLLRTRTGLANARKDLNSANNAVDLSNFALKNLLGISLEESLVLTEPLERPPRQDCGCPSLAEKAITQRPEISAIDFQIEAAEQVLKASRGEYLPSIALEGRYEYMQGDFRDFEGGEHWTVGIGAELPLWNWGDTAAKVTVAESQLKQLKIQRNKTADNIRFEVRRAYLELNKSEKNIDVAENALETAKEAYRQARTRFRAGEGTNTDVLDARTELSLAEANHTQALFDYNVALAALQKALGSNSIDRHDVENRESDK